MNDELKKLQAALRAATPKPEEAARKAALAAAQKSFERIQGTNKPARLISEAPQKSGSFWKGLISMISRIHLRPALFATSCLVIAGAAFVTYQPWGGGPTAYQAPEASIQEPDTRKRSQPALMNEPALDTVSPVPKKIKSPMRIATPAPNMLGEIVQQDTQFYDPPPFSGTGDRFSGADENSVAITTEAPVSTFSIDVDTASYAFIRQMILRGQLPEPDMVRIEEMVNYFPYDYPSPDIDQKPFLTQVSVVQTPWNPNTQLVHIGIQGAKPALDNRPPLNLVFLIDTSGSMQAPDKLPLLKQSFRLLLSELRPNDQVAIVTYAGSAGTVLEPTKASEKAKILAALTRLEAGGSTAGQAGLQQAYALARQMGGVGEIGRVLLATDGDFNVGISDTDALQTYVERQRDSGIYLSVFGFGQGNYRDDIMQTLAQNGNGIAAYIDTLAEAQKVLVDQVSGALFPIANDVKIQVEFNPAMVAEYRLIGYETRMLAREDFNNDKVDAGEIGAGHQVTALYEITPVGSSAMLNDPLRYHKAKPVNTSKRELGFLKLRYKKPGSKTSQLISMPIKPETIQPSTETGFAVAIAGFGQILKGGDFTGTWRIEDALALARAHKGNDRFGYRAEAIRLMQLAKSLP